MGLQPVYSCFLSRTWTLSFAAIALGVPTARAQTFTVDATTDAVDSNPGDGNCETAAGVCTIRAAIQEANALAAAGAAGPAQVNLPAGTYTLALAGSEEDAALTGDLDINASLAIAGAGADTTIVDAAALDRVFDVAPAVSGAAVDVSLTGITIRGGSLPGGPGLPANVTPGDGGGVRYAGLLVVRDCIVTDNVADHGGGLASTPTALSALVVDHSTVSHNQALSDGGGIDATHGPFALTTSVIVDNVAANLGGGVDSSDTIVTDSTFMGNSADEGGGAFIDCASISGSLFTANHASVGGGLASVGPCDSNIVNSTLSGNTATLQGGGLFVGGGGGSYNLTYVTIANNTQMDTAFSGGGIYKATGFEVKPLNVKNTIVALNAPGDCDGTMLTSLGNNLDSDNSCDLSTALNDMPGVDPLLGPLADNGGITQTQALLVGSPAIDAASDIAGIDVDQRAFSRPADGDGDGNAVSDIGAYELGGRPPKERPHKHHHKRFPKREH